MSHEVSGRAGSPRTSSYACLRLARVWQAYMQPLRDLHEATSHDGLASLTPLYPGPGLFYHASSFRCALNTTATDLLFVLLHEVDTDAPKHAKDRDTGRTRQVMAGELPP